MSLPNTYTSQNETGCCAIPDIPSWQDKEHIFDNEKFIKMQTKSFLYMPLNMSKIMKLLDNIATAADAKPKPEQAMVLSHDISPWRAEHLYRVTKQVEGQATLVLNGTYISKVFTGPYNNAKKWYKQMHSFANQKNKTIKTLYMFYTTCPKCAKHYGNNYVIGLAEV